MQSSSQSTANQAKSESGATGREFSLDAFTNTSRATLAGAMAAPSSANRTLPTGWTQQLTDTWERMRSNGSSRITVQLQLNQHERISVELRLQGQSVQTRFITDSESIRHGLQQHWDELVSRFAERGARLEAPVFQSQANSAFRQEFNQQAGLQDNESSNQPDKGDSEPGSPADNSESASTDEDEDPGAKRHSPPTTSTLSAWA